MNTEWIELSKRLHKEPYLLHARITPEALAKAAREDRMVVRMAGDRIIACGILWETPDITCLEVGTIYVDEPFRGNGLCRQVFLECIEKRKGRSLFLITSQESISKMVSKHGWLEEKRDWTKVEIWNLRANPWNDRYPENSSIKYPGKLFYRYW